MTTATKFLVVALAVGVVGGTSSAALAAPPKPPTRGAHAAPAVPARHGRHTLARSASASSSSVSNLSASGTCNWYYHQSSFSASVMLNAQRFPSGHYVYYEYAYRPTTSTTWTYKGWYGPIWVNNYVGQGAGDVFGPGPDIFAPQLLPGVSFGSISGWFVGWTQVAIWNGSYYEYTSTYGDYYENYGQYNLSGGRASSCWVSLT